MLQLKPSLFYGILEKKRRVLERVRLEKKKKNRALTTKKKGKIEIEHSQK